MPKAKVPLFKAEQPKPKQQLMVETEQYYTVNVKRGMYTGIPGITYPADFTVTSSRSR